MAALLHQKRLHVVKRDLYVGGDDPQTQGTTLSYQESVEGIPVMRWKIAHSEGVTVLDGKWIDPNRSHAVGDVRPRVVWQIKPAQLRLDGDLPGTGRGKEELVSRILERPDLPAKSFRLGQQPEEDVRIEEKPHAQFSKVLRTSSSSGASKSSGMTKPPRSTPKERSAPRPAVSARLATRTRSSSEALDTARN